MAPLLVSIAMASADPPPGVEQAREFLKIIERERVELAKAYDAVTRIYGIWRLAPMIDHAVLAEGRADGDPLLSGLLTDLTILALTDNETLIKRGGSAIASDPEWAKWNGTLRTGGYPYLLAIGISENGTADVGVLLIYDEYWKTGTVSIAFERKAGGGPPTYGWAIKSISETGIR